MTTITQAMALVNERLARTNQANKIDVIITVARQCGMPAAVLTNAVNGHRS